MSWISERIPKILSYTFHFNWTGYVRKSKKQDKDRSDISSSKIVQSREVYGETCSNYSCGCDETDKTKGGR